MLQQLKDLIDKLASDVYCAVTVTNNDTGEQICTEKLGSTMVNNKDGTVAGFFNDLYEKDIRRIVLQEKRKNGSGFKSVGRPFFADLNTKTESPAEPGATMPVVQQPVYQAVPHAGLGLPDVGLNGLVGLMGGLQGDMIHAHREYPKVEKERDALKIQVEAQKEKIADLKEELLKKDFTDAKATGNKDMLTGLADTFAPVIMAMLAGKNGGAAALPGAGGELNGAGEISPVKRQALELIMELDDSETGYMNATIQGFTNNEDFGNALIQLLKQHNLIPA